MAAFRRGLWFALKHLLIVTLYVRHGGVAKFSRVLRNFYPWWKEFGDKKKMFVFKVFLYSGLKHVLVLLHFLASFWFCTLFITYISFSLFLQVARKVRNVVWFGKKIILINARKIILLQLILGSTL